MKRDPVLAQLDFLINGPSPKAPRADEDALKPETEPPLLTPLHPPLPASDPVLAQLDALINGAAFAPLTTNPAAAVEPVASAFGGGLAAAPGAVPGR